MTPTGPATLRYEGDGEFKAPTAFWRTRCDKQFVVGETYTMEHVEGRSDATHKHQFAWLREAWLNLPEQYQHEPWAQSEDHLRKFALIRTGFCDTQTYACASQAEAARWAQNLRPLDEYSIVIVQGNTVVRYTAQSQSKRAMGAKRFQESKTAILDYIAGLIGVEPETLTKQSAPPARRAERDRPAADLRAGG